MDTDLRRYFDRELEDSDESAIRAMQRERLGRILDAVAHNRFYQRIYAGSVLGQARRTGDIRALPIIRKADILADSEQLPPFGFRLAVEPGQIANIVESSGTSGNSPEIQALTAADLDAVLAAEAVGFIWSGVSEGTVVALGVPVSMTAAGHWWTLTLYQLRGNVLRLGGADTLHRLACMRRYQVNQLMVGAHYLRRMTHVARSEGYDLARDFAQLDTIFLGGGGWTTETAAEWSNEWGVTLREQYGSSQRCFAWTCEQGVLRDGALGVVHNVPSHCLMEVLDPVTGEPAAEGQRGEIVITLLDQQAMPLVRYGTGDLAVARSGRSCGCGRAFDGIEAGSVSRIDGMLRVKGTNLWPDVVDSTVFSHAEIIDYRADVSVDEQARERLALTLEVGPAVASASLQQLSDAVAKELRAATSLQFAVRTVASTRDELASAKHASDKPRRWHDLRSLPAPGVRA